MKKNKSPGPDGFNVNFFLGAWEIVGPDFLKAVHHFFDSGSLPHYINASSIALIPKCANPSCMANFRPISCCNTIYKCIAKILAGRLKNLLPYIIDKAQAAFVQGRCISDNIMVAQELFQGYSSNSGTPKVAFKMDLHKAFDTLNWKFIIDSLTIRGFPPQFINWIHLCVTTPRFSVKVNGEHVGYFSGGRGIRQGDPLSPFLFVLAMDVLSAMLNKVQGNDLFKHHSRTKDLKLNHLSFADDLILFSHGSTSSVKLLMTALNEFSILSGLKANLSKSSFFTSKGSRRLDNWITSNYGITKGSFPAKFLGVPLITKKLTKRDCQPLMVRILSRITAWRTHFLSYAGRLQLIKSVLFAIQSYWSAHFILPKGIVNQLQSMFSRFLWNGNLEGKKAKVAWSSITKPFGEGGLGIKDIIEWNNALIMRHLLKLVNLASNSLWAS